MDAFHHGPPRRGANKALPGQPPAPEAPNGQGARASLRDRRGRTTRSARGRDCGTTRSSASRSADIACWPWPVMVTLRCRCSRARATWSPTRRFRETCRCRSRERADLPVECGVFDCRLVSLGLPDRTQMHRPW